MPMLDSTYSGVPLIENGSASERPKR